MTPENPPTTSQALRTVYHRLFQAYGPQHWWPGGSPFEVIIGAILTQSAAWANVDRALGNLKRANLLSLPALSNIPVEALAALLRPSGYYNAKARKVKAFVEHVEARYHGDLTALLAQPTEELRQELLCIHGIGPETADDILLYAANRPVFVVDAYTRRILDRLRIVPEGDRYDTWQALFHAALEGDAPLYNEYHALLVAHGKSTCRRDPRCEGCCLLDLCPTGQGQAQAPGLGPSPRV